MRATLQVRLVILIVLMMSGYYPVVHASELEEYIISGYVYDNDGSQLSGVKMILAAEMNVIDSCFSDVNGRYSLKANILLMNHSVYAICDQIETPGLDYLPSMQTVCTSSAGVTADFTLLQAVTLRFRGQFAVIESTRCEVTSHTFSVIDSKGERIYSGEIPLVYGTNCRNMNHILEFTSTDVIVPAGQMHEIEVLIAYKTKEETYGLRQYSIVDDTLRGDAGDRVEVDIRNYILPGELEKVTKYRDTVELKVEEAAELGFYVISERVGIESSDTYIDSCNSFLGQCRFDEALIDLNLAYMKLLNAYASIESMKAEAIQSANVMAVLVSMVSMVTAMVMVEGLSKRLILTEGLYIVMLVYLYIVYPGCRLVPTIQFMAVATASLIVLLFSSNVAPGLIPKMRRNRMGIFTGIITTLGIAKRELRRRKLRTIFTTSTLMVLIMGFVTLTSLSTGYGFFFKAESVDTQGVEGVQMRMQNYAPKEFMLLPSPADVGYFYAVSPMAYDWLTRYDEVSCIALKAESYSSLSGDNIIGVQPQGDPIMPLIDSAVTMGSPLREEGTCLVHESLIHVQLEIGDYYRGLKVVGAFSDSVRDILDLNGGSILPQKQVIDMKIEDRIWLKSVNCEPEETVITTLETAMGFNDVGIVRANIVFNPEVDAKLMCKSMALSSTYMFWVTSGGYTYLADLTTMTYAEGVSLAVIWGIVVLMVISTMISSINERKSEINIFSSIGLNPRHIVSIFLSEAAIMGTIAGGLGYLLGLGCYPVIAQLSNAPDVKMKVSAIWGFAALGVSFVSVVAGTLFALNKSVSLTPSLRRRWNPLETLRLGMDYRDPHAHPHRWFTVPGLYRLH